MVPSLRTDSVEESYREVRGTGNASWRGAKTHPRPPPCREGAGGGSSRHSIRRPAHQLFEFLRVERAHASVEHDELRRAALRAAEPLRVTARAEPRVARVQRVA